ncbi:acid sphingomyelinase-like phosphodiesterase 3b [Lineus longissimus]|uniref:acid sphingomyelinase-like phosphodiesterase 3b n=1 Tax=Lineus longissimus TaxID=88925 RepID=UPI002B4D0322
MKHLMHMTLVTVVFAVLPLTYTSLASETESDIGHFWQISDIHLDLDYSTDGDPENSCHKDIFPKNLTKLGEFGYPTCSSPWILVQGAVDAMKTIKAKPDFVLWTGDTSPKLPKEQLSQKKILDLIQRVTVLLNTTFPGIYLFPVLGNHDVYPVHQMPPSSKSTYYESVLKDGKWTSLLSEKEQETFVKGGYYSRMIKPGLTVAVLNTNLYYYRNELTKDLNDPAAQFDWLRKLLQAEKSVSHSVLVVGHVPPGSSELLSSINWFYPKFNENYLKVLKDYSSTVKAQIFAHEHEDTYRLLTSDKGSIFGSAFIQSSVTPFMGMEKAVNPSIRLYEYDRDSGKIIDFCEYFLDFMQANKLKKAEWKLRYQATKEYGIPDLSFDSLRKLTDSFSDDKSENFKKYFANLDSGYLKATCDADCKKLQLCAIEHVGYSSYNACLSKEEKLTIDPNTVETSLDVNSTITDPSYNFSSHPPVNSAKSHHHHPMPIYIFYILATLSALAIVFFMASAIICLRRKREPRYVRVVSLADMSAGYQ